VTEYHSCPIDVTVPVVDVEPPALIDPRLVAPPQVLPFERQLPPQADMPAGQPQV
jgi:hypothetical protein